MFKTVLFEKCFAYTDFPKKLCFVRNYAKIIVQKFSEYAATKKFSRRLCLEGCSASVKCPKRMSKIKQSKIENTTKDLTYNGFTYY